MKNKDIFIQDDISSCGAKCIQSIVSFYDGYVPLELVLEDTNTTTSGTSALNLVEALKKYGFDAYGLKISLDKIDKNKLPIIGHILKNGYEHFLVIYEIKENTILTMDPEYGKKIYSVEEFRKIFTKNTIVVTSRGEIPKFKKSKSLIKTFFPLIKEKKISIVIIAFSCILILLLNLITSFQLKLLNLKIASPILITCVLILCRIFANSMTLFKENVLEKVIKYIDDESLKNFTSHIFKLPIKYLHNKRVGEIVKKIEDMTFIKDLLIRLFIINSLDLLTIVILYPILLILSTKLTFIYSTILIVYTFITIFTQNILYKNEKKCLKTYNDYSGTLVEYLDGLESIKNLNATNFFLKYITDTLKNYTNVRLNSNSTNNRIKFIKTLLFDIGILCIGLVGYLSISESFTFLDLITYESIFSLFFLSFEGLTTTFEYFLKGKAIFRNICEFNDVREERIIPNYNKSFTDLKIKSLSFSYDRIHYQLRNFNFQFKKGEKILIKGPSGIGKSTLVKCLCGLLDKYEGYITLNDKNIKDISIDSLRSYLIYIGQEEKIFRKSILENVTLDDYDMDRFQYISNITLLDEVINKRRDKEHTTVLEGASNLSGGERARLILARALYKKPQILIIDETLSSVNENMEETILKNLLSIENMSLIYITHRNKEKTFKTIVNFRKDGTYEINRK